MKYYYYDQTQSGTRIKELRVNKHLTQERLAEELNIATSTLVKIERGERGSSIAVAASIATFFDTTLDYILLGKGAETPNAEELVKTVIAEIRKMKETSG